MADNDTLIQLISDRINDVHDSVKENSAEMKNLSTRLGDVEKTVIKIDKDVNNGLRASTISNGQKLEKLTDAFERHVEGEDRVITELADRLDEHEKRERDELEGLKRRKEDKEEDDPAVNALKKGWTTITTLRNFALWVAGFAGAAIAIAKLLGLTLPF